MIGYGRPVRVELHEHGWESLLTEWASVFAADAGRTLFSSAAWALAWWHHWADGAEPWVLTVRDAGGLIAVMPFFLRRRLGRCACWPVWARSLATTGTWWRGPSAAK